MSNPDSNEIFPTLIPAGIDPDGSVVYDAVYDIPILVQKPVEFINLTFTVQIP